MNFRSLTLCQVSLDRRRFLEYAAAITGVSTLAYLGYDVLNSGKQAETRTISTNTTSLQLTTTSTPPVEPLATKDLYSQVNAFNNDLTSFGNGNVSQSMIQNAEDLRVALRNYSPQNRETEGQVKRLDQLALSGLLLYSWASRLQQDDVKAITDKRFNPPDIMPASSRISELLGLEVNPPPEYFRNVGTFQTDVATEHFVAPPLRAEFAALYDSLDQDTKAQLKQAFESYNPIADSIQDFKQITEEHIWITSMNGWLKWLLNTPGDVYSKDVKTVFENGIARNASLGRIANIAYDILPRRFYAERDGYSQYIDSALGEIPQNHRELNDYDFAIAVMKTPTILDLGRRIQACCGNPMDTGTAQASLAMDGAFHAALLFDARKSYWLAEFPPSDPDFNGYYDYTIKFKGTYYFPWFRTKFIDPNTPFLTDIAEKDTGYGGWHKDWYYAVTESILDYWSTIPVFVYNPNKGVVLND